jgi:ATP-dependent DNA helicase RecG
MASETNRIEYKRELTESLEKEIVAFLNYHEVRLFLIGLRTTSKQASDFM